MPFKTFQRILQITWRLTKAVVLHYKWTQQRTQTRPQSSLQPAPFKRHSNAMRHSPPPRYLRWWSGSRALRRRRPSVADAPWHCRGGGGAGSPSSLLPSLSLTLSLTRSLRSCLSRLYLARPPPVCAVCSAVLLSLSLSLRPRVYPR